MLRYEVEHLFLCLFSTAGRSIRLQAEQTETIFLIYIDEVYYPIDKLYTPLKCSLLELF